MIRLAKFNEINRILYVFDCARQRMRLQGNVVQWDNNYPSYEIVENDIKENQCYVIEENNEIVGVFVFFIGIDPTYQKIDGAWLNHEPYGVIHRVGGLPQAKHIFEQCVDFCSKRIANLRIDTHESNSSMCYLLKKHEFQYCGIIQLEDGGERIAFHKQL